MGVLDADRRFLRVNDALAELSGVPADAHVGRGVADVLGDEAAATVTPILDRAYAGEALSDLELETGTRRFRVSCLPVALDGGRRGVATVVVETTGERRAEVALRVSEQRLHLALEGTRTGTWEWDVQADEIRWSPMVHVLHGLDVNAAPPTFEEYQRLVHAEDLSTLTDAIGRALDGADGYEAEFRVVHPDGSVHWIETRAHAQRGEDGTVMRLVGLTSDITERRRRELDADLLNRASALLAQPVNADETLRALAQLVVPELADWCTIVLPDDAGELRTVAVAHTDAEKISRAREIQRRYPPRRDAPNGPAAVLRTGAAELHEEVADDVLREAAEDDEHLTLLRELGLHSAIVVPLAARGRTLGAITLVSSDARQSFDGRDLALAEELGRRAGLALDNARLLDAERVARQAAESLSARLAVLQSVVELGLTHLDLDDLLGELLRRITAVVDAYDAAIVMRTDDSGYFATRASVGFEGLELPTRFPEDAGITGRVVRANAPVIVEELSEDESVVPGLAGHSRSLVSLPLRRGEDVIGVLHVVARERRRFDEDEVQLLMLVAERAAQAIEHARLYEQASTTSRTLQRSLLPAHIPQLDGLEVAAYYAPGQDGTEVGGDWYDVFPLPGDRAGVVVGDVVGRGVHAAATMGRLRTALHMTALDAEGAADAVDRVRRFVDAAPDGDFATLVLLTIDGPRRSGRVCSAGHLPPVLVDPDGRASLIPLHQRPPLGSPETEPGDETTVLLAPGSVVLLYTDGLVERRGEALDARIEELVVAAANPPDDLAAYVSGLVAALGVEDARRDDVALIALRVTA